MENINNENNETGIFVKSTVIDTSANQMYKKMVQSIREKVEPSDDLYRYQSFLKEKGVITSDKR